MPETDTNNPVSNPQWPNQKPIVDGVTPVTDVPQDPYLHVDTDDSLRTEMGV